MQMAAAYGAIANGGVWLQPHLVDRVEGSGRVEPKERRVLSEATAAQLTRMLRGVVEEGSGDAAQIPGYRVAGKTGTAAKPEPTGGYSTRATSPRSSASPRPSTPSSSSSSPSTSRGAIWGGVVAAPAVREIMEFALQYLEVPPDRRGAEQD